MEEKGKRKVTMLIVLLVALGGAGLSGFDRLTTVETSEGELETTVEGLRKDLDELEEEQATMKASLEDEALKQLLRDVLAEADASNARDLQAAETGPPASGEEGPAPAAPPRKDE